MAGSKKLVGKHREVAYKMLHTVCSILEEENIPYVLEAGTLLGVIRENRLLPWDTDIDLTITSDYAEQLLAIRNRFVKAGYRTKIRKHTVDIDVIKKGQARILKVQTRKFYFFKEHSLMDIFIKYKAGDKYLWTVDDANPVLKKCPAKFYDNKVRYEFDGRTFWVPAEYINYLSYHYGKEWDKPIMEWDFRLDDHCERETLLPDVKKVNTF